MLRDVARWLPESMPCSPAAQGRATRAQRRGGGAGGAEMSRSPSPSSRTEKGDDGRKDGHGLEDEHEHEHKHDPERGRERESGRGLRRELENHTRTRRDDRDSHRGLEPPAHDSTTAHFKKSPSREIHSDQKQRRQSISAHSQTDSRVTATPTPPPAPAATATAAATSATTTTTSTSASMFTSAITSTPGPTSGASLGNHRESFSRTPARGSMQQGPSFSENVSMGAGTSELLNDGFAGALSPHYSQQYTQVPSISQSHLSSQQEPQMYQGGDAATALSYMNPPLSTPRHAANMTPRSNAPASPHQHPHPLSRQQDDRVRREQAREYGPGRGHSESYNKLWRDYHNHHEDIPLKRNSGGAATSPSARGRKYENGHAQSGQANEFEYHGLPTSTPPQSQLPQSQSYPDPRASTTMTSYQTNRMAPHPPDAAPMAPTTTTNAAGYDRHPEHHPPQNDEDEPDHGQDNIEVYERPQIWTAVYSNVSVYETIVNSIAVMRRRTDSWLNATQILKVAGVPKARRTKILQALEREAEPHKHEKVQGGYGKYQGTWVEFERGRELCREWGVEDILRPLLELKGEKWDGYNEAYGYPYTQGFAAGFPTKHVKEQQAARAAQNSSRQPPTKEEVMAMQRKRIYKGLDQPGSASPTGSNGRGNRSPGVAGSTDSSALGGGVPHHTSSAPSPTTIATAAGLNEASPTYLQNISNTAASAVSAMNRARYDSPLRNETGAPQQQQQGQLSQSSVTSQQLSQSQSQPTHRRSQSQIQMPPPETTTPIAAGAVHHLAETPDNSSLGGPPRKRMRSYTEDQIGNYYASANMFDTPKTQNRVSFATNTAGGVTPLKGTESMPPPAVHASATEPSMSSFRFTQLDGASGTTSTPAPGNSVQAGSHSRSLFTPAVIKGLPHLPPATTADRFKKMKLVMTLFLDKKVKDFSDHPAILTLDPIDLEIPLDEHMNTALHWASMLARMPLVTALVKKGVSIFRLNKNGESALHKAVGTRNNYDYRSFGKLLQVLAPTIELIDGTGRSLLHHICIMAATGGGGHVAARHYLETLLEFLSKQKGKQPSQPTGSAAAGRSQDDGLARSSEGREIITLDRFMATMVNVQDDSGDTPLNIAGRANTSLVPQLIELGADAWIPNHSGLKPADYGVGVDLAGKSRRSRDDGVVEGLAESQQADRGPGGSAYPGPGHSFTSTSRFDPRRDINHAHNEASDERTIRQNRKAEVRDDAIREINNLIHNHIEEFTRSLTLRTSHKNAETRRWHERIRESARARQAEQKELEELTWKQRRRLELERRTRNLESSKRVLMEKLSKQAGSNNSVDEMDVDGKEIVGSSTAKQEHSQALWKIGHADKSISVDPEKFKEVFPDGLAALSAAAEQLAPLDTTDANTTIQTQPHQSATTSSDQKSQPLSDSHSGPQPPPSGTVPAQSSTSNTLSSTTFTSAQKAYLSTLPSRAILKRILAAYTTNNSHLMAEIDALKSKNVALGDTYRRIVMACTGWTAEQVDEAAVGLTECVKEMNESPLPEEEAIEILMRERGQDW